MSVPRTHSLMIWLAMAGLAMALLFACGCGTARQHMYAGQAFDLGSTAVMLNQRGFYEANPLADDVQDVLILKAVFCGIVELMVWADPEHAKGYYKFGAVAGYVAGAWNTGLMLDKK